MRLALRSGAARQWLMVERVRGPWPMFNPKCPVHLEIMMPIFPNEFVLSSSDDACLRRLAISAGYVLRKSRWRSGSIDNHGGYMLVDPDTGGAVAGGRFDLTGSEVAEYLRA